MIAIISPAKNLDEKTEFPELPLTLPHFLENSESIMKVLKTKSARSLGKMMGINPELAELNFERNQKWSSDMTSKESRPAIRMFRGDVYQGMKPWDWAIEDYTFAQEHLLILSGLHGLLRPLDMIKPYRLEMGTKLKIKSKKNLYAFWGDAITKKLNQDLERSGSKILINLASKEYFSSVNPSLINGQIIKISMKEYRNGEYKFMSFFGKKARGFMAGFIIKNKILEPEGLKEFEVEGYSFNPSISSDDHWVFSREN
jgi:uncharacterized protein